MFVRTDKTTRKNIHTQYQCQYQCHHNTIIQYTMFQVPATLELVRFTDEVVVTSILTRKRPGEAESRRWTSVPWADTPQEKNVRRFDGCWYTRHPGHCGHCGFYGFNRPSGFSRRCGFSRIFTESSILSLIVVTTLCEAKNEEKHHVDTNDWAFMSGFGFNHGVLNILIFRTPWLHWSIFWPQILFFPMAREPQIVFSSPIFDACRVEVGCLYYCEMP